MNGAFGTLSLYLLLGTALVEVEAQEERYAQVQPSLRVDTFDLRSNRTGHIIVDPKTGRFDQFDLRSNRQGHGYISPPPGPTTTNPADVQLWDRHGQRINTK